MPDELDVIPHDMMEMSDLQLLEQLYEAGLAVPPGLAASIADRGDAMVGPLCDILLDDQMRRAPAEGPGSWASTHALHLLGAIGAPEAVPAVVELVRREPHDEFVLDSAPTVLGRLGPAAIAPLEQLARDPDSDPATHVATAMSALVIIGYIHPAERPRITDFLVRMLGEHVYEDVVTWTISAAVNVHEEKVRLALGDAFSRGAVDEFIVDRRGWSSSPSTSPSWSPAGWTRDPMEHFTARHLSYLREANV